MLHSHQTAAQLMGGRSSIAEVKVCHPFFYRFKVIIQAPLRGFHLSFFLSFGITSH